MRTHVASAEIAQQDDVAGDFAPAEQQLFSVISPVKVENLTRGEIGHFVGWSALPRLLPEAPLNGHASDLPPWNVRSFRVSTAKRNYTNYPNHGIYQQP